MCCYLTAECALWAKARDLYEQIGAKRMAEEVQGWIDQLPS